MSRSYERIVLQGQVSRKQGNSPTVIEHVWVIPEGLLLKIDRFSGGHEYSVQEVRLELCLRSGGSDSTLAIAYSGAFQFIIEQAFTGNGSDAIVMRHINGDSSELHMASWWEGVTVDG